MKIILAVIAGLLVGGMVANTILSIKCKQLNGVAVNGGSDCWVEGRGYVNQFSTPKE